MRRYSGFTLMEMLIAIAIVAILCVIAFPVFYETPEKAREASDQGNIRAAYAQILADAMLAQKIEPSDSTYIHYNYNPPNDYSALVYAKQKDDSGWVSNDNTASIELGGIGNVKAVAKPGSWTLTYNVDTGEITIK